MAPVSESSSRFIITVLCIAQKCFCQQEEDGIFHRGTNHSSFLHQFPLTSTIEPTEAYPVANYTAEPYDTTNITALNGSDISFDPKIRTDGYNLTKAEDSPYAVSLMMYVAPDKYIGSCSGSLLTAEWVLTAAHCILDEEWKAAYIKVKAGDDSVSKNKSVQSLKSVELHPFPRYSFDLDHDVALVKLEKKFNLTKTVNTIAVTNQPWSYYSYRNCVFVGFGGVYYKKDHADDYKRKTHLLRMKKPCICQWKLKKKFGKGPATRCICSQPKEDFGVCSGDSGGGLVCDGQIRAVAMSIMKMNPKNLCKLELYTQCGTEYGMNVFLDICPYVKWINSLVELYSEAQISDQCDVTDTDDGSFVEPLGVYILLVVIVISYYYSYIFLT